MKKRQSNKTNSKQYEIISVIMYLFSHSFNWLTVHLLYIRFFSRHLGCKDKQHTGLVLEEYPPVGGMGIRNAYDYNMVQWKLTEMHMRSTMRIQRKRRPTWFVPLREYSTEEGQVFQPWFGFYQTVRWRMEVFIKGIKQAKCGSTGNWAMLDGWVFALLYLGARARGECWKEEI